MEAFLSGIMDDSALSDDLMDDEYYLFAGEGFGYGGLLHQHHDLSDDANPSMGLIKSPRQNFLESQKRAENFQIVTRSPQWGCVSPQRANHTSS
ncbi:hypothetical protein ZWY2020_057014 [Hordeum vulgare]|nr:hypothetical protein ZWY2020_057014 [Hordeum vulgare]